MAYARKQPARCRKFAFAITAWVNVDALQNYFVLSYTTIATRNFAVNMRSIDLDSLEVSFSSTVNMFCSWMEGI